jgi:anti-sigma regulatory factor (Ser/Thr protein kinase)
MPGSRLTLSNRPENLKVLLHFLQKWAQDHALAPPRRAHLEQVAAEIFQHLLTHAFRSDQPGSIAVVLEEKGPRLRLMFEDDAPHTSIRINGPGAPDAKGPSSCDIFLSHLDQIAESVIFYRTTEHKNRLVVFLT